MIQSEIKFDPEAEYVAELEKEAAMLKKSSYETMKTYRAIRHDIIRQKQKSVTNDTHHPDEKVNQIRQVLLNPDFETPFNCLELFSGIGNCSIIYNTICSKLTCFELNKEKFDRLVLNDFGKHVQLNNKNSFREYHRLIADGKKFNVVDLDPYGFPTRLFPDIFLLIDNGYLFVTMPKPYVNILNGITATHLISYFGEQNPSSETIINKIALMGLSHWRKVELISELDLKSVWRYAFRVEKVKATDYTGVRNR